MIREPESAALGSRVDGSTLVTSALSTTEVGRVLRRDPTHGRDPAAVWRAITLIDVDRDVLRRAVAIDQAHLRSLDAIHLATALTVADELEAFITYDRQLGRAATAAGLPVEAPGRAR